MCFDIIGIRLLTLLRVQHLSIIVGKAHLDSAIIPYRISPFQSVLPPVLDPREISRPHSMAVGGVDGASSIQVAVRVRPFTIREAAQLTKTDDSPLFLGDGSLAGVPSVTRGQKGLKSVIKVVDEKCLWVSFCCTINFLS